jgi:hypothetical protein
MGRKDRPKSAPLGGRTRQEAQAFAAQAKRAGDVAWRNADYALATKLYSQSVEAVQEPHERRARPQSAPAHRGSGDRPLGKSFLLPAAHVELPRKEEDFFRPPSEGSHASRRPIHTGNLHYDRLARQTWYAADVRKLTRAPLEIDGVKVTNTMEPHQRRIQEEVEAKYDIPKEGPRDQIKRMIAAGTKDHVAQSVFCQPIIRPVRTDAQDMLQYTRIKQKECKRARSYEGQRHFLKRNYFTDFNEQRQAFQVLNRESKPLPKKVMM